MIEKRVWSLSAVVLTACALLSACSGVEENPNTEGRGVTTITKEDGEQIRLSGEAEIPEGFPADVPIPANVAVTSSISGDDTATVSIETEMPFEEAVALYYGYAQEAGYSEAYKMEEADFFNYSGRKDNEQFVVTLQLDLEDNKTVTGILVYGKTEN